MAQRCGCVGVPHVGYYKLGLNSASIFRRTCSLIWINGGQGRLKPSPGSFFVASMPSLLPLAISLVAWSSTSDGPLVKRLSRCGSVWGAHAPSRASVSASLTEPGVARRWFRRGRRNRHARARVLRFLFVEQRINFLLHGFIHFD